MIDEAVYRSMGVPSFKYNQPPFDVYLERSPKLKMHKESAREAESKKVKKSDAPSPLSYKAAESYDKTQAHRSSCVKITKDAKLLKFTGKGFYV